MSENDLRETILDYFENDREGWSRGWLAWRDKAAKAVGLPTSEELKAIQEVFKEVVG